MQGVRHRPIVGPDLLTGPMFENTMVSRMIFSLFPWVRVTYTGDEALSSSLFPLSLLPISRNTLLLPLAVCLYVYFFSLPFLYPVSFFLSFVIHFIPMGGGDHRATGKV